jgi:hypothetical protein
MKANGKKQVLVPLVILLFCGCGFAQPTHVDIEGLFGKVKRVDERSADIEVVDGVRKEKKELTEFSKVFDEKGRLTYEVVTGENIVERRHTYSKDGIRRTVGEDKRPFEKPNPYKRPSLSAARFIYDEKENSISEDIITGRDFGDPVVELTEFGQRYKYFFDSANRLTKKVVMEPNLKVVMTYEYFYRAPGPPTDVVISSRGRAIQFIKYKYVLDADGNWTRRESEARSTNPNHPVRFDVMYRKIAYHR